MQQDGGWGGAKGAAHLEALDLLLERRRLLGGLPLRRLQPCHLLPAAVQSRLHHCAVRWTVTIWQWIIRRSNCAKAAWSSSFCNRYVCHSMGCKFEQRELNLLAGESTVPLALLRKS